MRRRLLFAVAPLPVAVVVTAAACNPLFGIVSRQAGPTWCEEDAQATVNGYCDDFDRITSQTTSQEIVSPSIGGMFEITDAEAHSLPNSFGVSSALTAADDGGAIGHLVAFGPTSTDGIVSFSCQADVRAVELAAILSRASAVGVLGIGAQAHDALGAPEVAVLAFGDTGEVGLGLAKLPSPTSPAQPVSGHACGAKGTPPLLGDAGADWITIELSVTADGGPVGLACPLGDAVGPGKNPYLIRVLFNHFEIITAYVRDPGFYGQPYFVYGMFLQSGAPTTVLHFDNVRCTTEPDAGP